VPAPPQQPVEETVSFRVQQPQDDTYQLYGHIVRSPNYLRIGYTYQAGFRFTNVKIPKGAEILEARLQLASPWYHEGKPSVVRVCGDNSGNSAPLTGELRKRSLTSCINWSIGGVWRRGEYQDSADLSYIIQEIINRPDWRSGNSLTLITKENYKEYWPVTPFESNSQKAARLVVHYRIYKQYSQPLPSPTITPTPSPAPTTTPVPSPTITPSPTPRPEGLIDRVEIGYFDGSRQVALCNSKIEVSKKSGTLISHLYYYVDGVLKGEKSRDQNKYIFYLDTTKLSNGNHQLKVVAEGTSGGKEEKTAAFYVRNSSQMNNWWDQSLKEIKKIKSKTHTRTVPLMFHLFSDDHRDEDTVTYDQFYCLLSNLEASGYHLVNLAEFYKVENGQMSVANPVMVTMDDAQVTQYKALENILPHFDRKALLAAPVGWIGKSGHFTASQLRHFAQEGFDIQDHSYTHPRLTRLSESELEYELGQSKKELEKITGRPVTAVVYPFGAVNDFVKQKVKELGFLSGFVVDNYWRSSDIYSVARAFIKGQY